MAKTLTLSLSGTSFNLLPKKVDRNKLYGHTELRVVNSDGALCSQAAINSDGVNIICPGATKIGIVDQSGNWVERQSLVPVSVDGSALEWIPSSFEHDVMLTREATPEELLDLNIQSVYLLAGTDADALISGMGDRIFAFDFSYRGGYESNAAYLIANEHGLFMLTGIPGSYEYLGLDETAELDNPDEDFDIDEMEFEFSMM